MNLLADYDSSSDDGGSDAEDKVQFEKIQSPSKTIKLPSAASVMKRKMSSESSVLATGYQKKENDKNKVLEHHVKMVDNSKSISGKINGKVICWMYRRGRCRAGRRCPMYHDSELQTQNEHKSEEGSESQSLEQQNHIAYNKRGLHARIEDEADDEPKNKVFKKKFGITDNIVPSKKVLRHFESLKKK